MRPPTCFASTGVRRRIRSLWYGAAAGARPGEEPRLEGRGRRAGRLHRRRMLSVRGLPRPGRGVLRGAVARLRGRAGRAVRPDGFSDHDPGARPAGGRRAPRLHPAGLIHGANFAFRTWRCWRRSGGLDPAWSTITTGARRERTRCGFAGCTTRRAAPTTRSASWIGACAPDTWAPGCASSPPSARGAPRGSSGGRSPISGRPSRGRRRTRSRTHRCPCGTTRPRTPGTRRRSTACSAERCASAPGSRAGGGAASSRR